MERDPGLDPFVNALADLESRDRLRRVGALEGLPGKHVIREGRRCLNLSSNDYLGLAGHPDVKRAAADAALRHGAGAGGSRLLGGGLPLHRELERAVEALRPLAPSGKALLFNTGFMANLGALEALAPMVGPVFSDKLNHASVAGALRTMPGKYHRYRHGDMTHLEALLREHAGSAAGTAGGPGRAGGAAGGPGLVVSETLFSMDGDFAPLDALLALQKRHGFWLYLDEAHSTGCRPDLAERAMAGAVPGRLILMGTFGKAYGGSGAYVAGPAPVVDWLANAARSFVFSTAMPPAAAGAALEALRVAEREPWRRERLRDAAAAARERFRRAGFDTGRSESHIIPVIAGSDADAVALSAALFREGFHAPPVRPPTVPAGTARLRINLTAEMDEADVAALAEGLEKARDGLAAGRVAAPAGAEAGGAGPGKEVDRA